MCEPMKPRPPVTRTLTRPPRGRRRRSTHLPDVRKARRLCARTFRRVLHGPRPRHAPTRRRPQGLEQRGAKAQPTQALGLLGTGRGGAHRDAVEDPVLGSQEAQGPPAPVESGAQGGARGVQQRLAGLVEESWGDLGGVHPDLQRRSVDVSPCVLEPVGEAAPPLGEDTEAGREPLTWWAVQGDPALVGAALGHAVQGVGQCCGGHIGGLRGCERGTQPGLDLPGHRSLGHHEDLHAGSRSNRLMSRIAPVVPRRVPVTFDRPTRGR